MSYDDFIEIQPGVTIDIEVEVTPEIIKTDPNLKSVNPEDRECYFENEKFLKYFKIYTDKNCELECLANFTLAQCDCIPYNLPRDQTIKVCTSEDAWHSCEDNAIKEARNSKYFTKNCGCMPSCDSILYRVKYFSLFNLDESESEINIRVNSDGMILMRRHQQFTISDAISYMGGIMGLLAGISMLTIVEYFYFLIVKILKFFVRTFNKISVEVDRN